MGIKRRRGETRPCQVHHCTATANDFRSLCHKHYSAHSVHGHALQKGVKIGDLKPYLDQLEAFRKTPAGAEAVNAVIQHYNKLCDHLEGELDTLKKEGRGPVWDFEMREIIVKTGYTKDREATVMQMLALAFMWFFDGDGWFQSDIAFKYQIVNVYLKGSSAWMRKTVLRNGTPSSFRKRIKVKTRMYVAGVLMDHLLKHGVTIADRLQRAAKKKDEEQKRIVELIDAAVS